MAEISCSKTFSSHLLAVSLWLAAVEAKGAEVLEVSQGTLGIEALGVSAGRHPNVAHWETAVKAGTMEAEKTWDSAPPTIFLCSADPLLPAV